MRSQMGPSTSGGHWKDGFLFNGRADKLTAVEDFGRPHVRLSQMH